MEEQQTERPTPPQDFVSAGPAWWPDNPIQWALDRWIQLLGIVFLLIGVGFLFKYSYDHGLLVPPLRVLCGAGVGGALAFAGWKLRESRRALAHVLLGGASATFYITLYAASELYSLVPGGVAFAGMIAVTMATFVAAVTQRGVVLANIATIGGYLTPFLLDVPLSADPQLNDVGTLVYMCVVFAGSSAIYLFKGWRSVLVTSTMAMWGYLGLATLGVSTPFEKTAIQLAIVFAWFGTAVVPVARLYLSRSASNAGLAHLFAITVPGWAMLLSRGLWDAGATWGAVTLLLAAAYAAASLFLRRDGSRSANLATTHALVAIGLTTLGLTDFLSGPTLMIGLLVEAVALCWAGFALEPEEAVVESAGFGWLRERRLFRVLGHLLLFVVCIDTVSIFAGSVGSTPFLNPEGLQLLATAAGLWLVGYTHERDAVAPGFEWAAHVLLLGAVLHQTSGMVHGDLVATACWGVYSLVLVTVGLSSQQASRQWMGLTALLLTAGKLLFIDMSGAETLWRVLLFMAFGIALLALSYVAPRWIQSQDSGNEPPLRA